MAVARALRDRRVWWIVGRRGLALLVAFGVAINLAVDVRRGVAMGLLAAIAYVVVDVILAVNPGVWRWPQRSPKA